MSVLEAKTKRRKDTFTGNHLSATENAIGSTVISPNNFNANTKATEKVF